MLSKELWYPRFQLASDRSLLVTFGAGISRRHHLDVRRLVALLESQPIPGTHAIHPAYSSVLVSFNPRENPPPEFEAGIRDLVQQIDSVRVPEPRRIEIPVCYGGKLGPDLDDVALHNRVTTDEVVRRHSSTEYLVYFLGFSPGFPYMGDMPKELAIPRLGTPRRVVPACSVAIGGRQTGIYPVASPGGWRIIGRTPLRLFRPEEAEPTLLRMGDLVRFKAINIDEFQNLKRL
ncbi:MAG: 5-oxoprolinase subunit PxpB [Bacteroidota bacterium]